MFIGPGSAMVNAYTGGALGPVGVALAFAFVVMFVVMAVATDERVADGVAALAVGLTVGFCALMGGQLTGASMNPARSFGPAVIGGIWRAHCTGSLRSAP